MSLKSLIFVPGKEKMLRKLGSFNADAYIIDLEDSIEENEKMQALENVVKALDNFKQKTYSVYVRLNSTLYLEEIEKLKRFSDIGFMLPKFETPEMYEGGKEVWENHKVVALIETPGGMIQLDKIASCPWVDSLAFGAEDYTAKVNMKNSINTLYYQKSKIVTYAKAYGKTVFDTPSFQLENQDEFESEVKNSVDLGFDGKLAINPKQIAFINECFGSNDIVMYKEIVNQYEISGQAVLVWKGKVYEKMHIERMKRIIKESEEN